jgi:hypothetical protein
MQANPNTSLSDTDCSSEPISETCQPVLKPSCVNGNFFGDPAVRLDAVVQSVPSPNRVTGSICDSSYQSTLERVGQQIAVALSGVSCFAGVLPDPAKPECVVEEIAADGRATPLPACATSDGAGACWRLATRDSRECPGVCANRGDPAQRYAIEIVRAAPPAAGTTARASCRLQPTTTSSNACR